MRSPERFSPRNTIRHLCSFTVSTKTSTPGNLISRRISHSSLFFSVGMRPALLSRTLPFSSMVQKFPRAATSPGCRSKPIPSAASTPRPTLYFTGS